MPSPADKDRLALGIGISLAGPHNRGARSARTQLRKELSPANKAEFLIPGKTEMQIFRPMPIWKMATAGRQEAWEVRRTNTTLRN